MPPMTPVAPPSDKSNLISNILAIVGFIIVTVIVVWGLLSLAGFSKPFWGSIFKKTAAIKVTVPTSAVPSGQPLTVSWKYDSKLPGTFAFLYQCRTGFQFKTAGADNAQNPIPCGAAYTIPGKTNSLSVTPFVAGTSTTTIPISIVWTGSATSSASASGSAMVTVKPAEAPAVEVITPPAKAEVAPSKMKESGLPELSVRILSVGVIDPISGNIIPRRPISQNELVAVRFDIANEGTSSTGTWYFTAQLPTLPPYTYNSPPQASLAPKDHIENMLRFRQVPPEGGTFSVYADPSNLIREPNEVNNYANQNI